MDNIKTLNWVNAKVLPIVQTDTKNVKIICRQKGKVEPLVLEFLLRIIAEFFAFYFIWLQHFLHERQMCTLSQKAIYSLYCMLSWSATTAKKNNKVLQYIKATSNPWLQRMLREHTAPQHAQVYKIRFIWLITLYINSLFHY